jgi:hypothetical protein
MLYSTRMKTWHQSWFYHQLKDLFLISGTPSKVKLFHLVFDASPDEYSDSECQSEAARYLLKFDHESRMSKAKMLNYN